MHEFFHGLKTDGCLHKKIESCGQAMKITARIKKTPRDSCAVITVMKRSYQEQYTDDEEKDEHRVGIQVCIFEKFGLLEFIHGKRGMLCCTRARGIDPVVIDLVLQRIMVGTEILEVNFMGILVYQYFIGFIDEYKIVQCIR
jgi:hypothetical protein